MANNVNNNLVIATAGRRAALNAITALIGSGGKITLYTAPKPASPDVGLTGQVALVTCNLSATAFGGANSSAVAIANTIAHGNPVANGVATWYRLYTGTNAALIDGTVGVSGFDLNVVSTTISVGVPLSITSFTLTHP